MMPSYLAPIRNKQGQIEYRYIRHRLKKSQGGISWASCYKPTGITKPVPMKLPRYLELKLEVERKTERKNKLESSENISKPKPARMVNFSQPCKPPKEIPTPV
jgi:hypothetical protein